MKTKIIPVLALASAFAVVGCSSSVEEKATTSKNALANSQNVANPNLNTNTVAITNGMPVPAQPADPNVAASSEIPQEGLQTPGMMQKRGDKLRQSGGSSEKVDAAAIAMKSARPAPDNSTFTSYLAEAGYEIRTFKQHPQLLKVEKRIENNANQTVKIFLRNGQVIERAGQDIPSVATASAADILTAAGVAPAGPPATKKPSGN